MGRHTNKQRRERTITDNFDRVYIEVPGLPHIATIVAMPLKTIFINSTADYSANVDKVIFDLDELAAYLPEMWMM